MLRSPPMRMQACLNAGMTNEGVRQRANQDRLLAKWKSNGWFRMNKFFSRVGATLCGSLLLAACSRSHPGPAPTGVATADPASHVAVAAMVLNSDALAAAQPSATCSLDQVDGAAPSGNRFTADAGGTSTFRGWAADATGAAPPSVTLVLQGAKTYGLSTLAGQDRPDVAQLLGNPAAQAAGFRFDATLQRVAAGTYGVSLWIDTSTGNTLCDTHKQIVVKP